MQHSTYTHYRDITTHFTHSHSTNTAIPRNTDIREIGRTRIIADPTCMALVSPAPSAQQDTLPTVDKYITPLNMRCRTTVFTSQNSAQTQHLAMLWYDVSTPLQSAQQPREPCSPGTPGASRDLHIAFLTTLEGFEHSVLLESQTKLNCVSNTVKQLQFTKK